MSFSKTNKDYTVSLTFLGGAQTVTGSKFLLEWNSRRILIDCGLFQGLKELRALNWAPFPIDPKSIHAVFITHAHLDHVGYLPLLVKGGFCGPVYVTAPTRALAEIILLDASHIQEEDAIRAIHGGYSKHKIPRPLFTVEESKIALSLFTVVSEEKWHPLFSSERFRFIPSGHILGSSFVEFSLGGKHWVFTGDLGREKPLLLKPRNSLSQADYLICESTYGDRNHPKEPVLRQLHRILWEGAQRGGDILIPSFAVGRSQDILYLLAQLKKTKQLPELPIYFDTPMGIEATNLLSYFPEWHRLSPSQMKELRDVATFVPDVKRSVTLAKSRKQKIVIAGSGMMTGGRILNYLEKAVSDEKNTILLVGYQAIGTRGRQLRDRLSEIKLFGSFLPVKAKVEEIPGLSAHADQKEILSWLSGFRTEPNRVFLVHGEPGASDVLRLKIKDVLGWDVTIPGPGSRFEMN